VTAAADDQPTAGPDELPELLAARRRKLERLGVNVWTNSVVTGISDGKVHLRGETIEAGTILWAAGVSASPLGRSLGVPLDRAGRVLVNDDLSVPGHPEIFVIGDLAALILPQMLRLLLHHALVQRVQNALGRHHFQKFAVRRLRHAAQMAHGAVLLEQRLAGMGLGIERRVGTLEAVDVPVPVRRARGHGLLRPPARRHNGNARQRQKGQAAGGPFFQPPVCPHVHSPPDGARARRRRRARSMPYHLTLKLTPYSRGGA